MSAKAETDRGGAGGPAGPPAPPRPDIPYRLRRSDRARRLRVSVERDGDLQVVIPRRMGQAAVDAALVELRPWIDKRLQAVAAQRARVLARGDTLPYLDEQLRLVAQAGRERVTRHAQTLLVPAGDSAQAALENWYRRMARREIEPRLDLACARTGLTYTRLTIRDQRTRWGSCSRGGALSFNWRLLLAPAAVLDYVVWHEVCHLAVMDHSPRFWAMVARHCPEHRAHAAWLRENAATLVL